MVGSKGDIWKVLLPFSSTFDLSELSSELSGLR